MPMPADRLPALARVSPTGSRSVLFPLHRSRGFTLIELIAFIVMISLGLAGVLSAINSAAQHDADPMVRIRAVELGQAYLDEILQRRFDETSGLGGTPRCGSIDVGSQPCSGTLGPEAEARADYDDVDDYHGLNDNPPVDALGNQRPGYGGFSVQISVLYAGADLGLAAQDAKRIDVTVNSALGDSMVFSAYRSNF